MQGIPYQMGYIGGVNSPVISNMAPGSVEQWAQLHTKQRKTIF